MSSTLSSPPTATRRRRSSKTERTTGVVSYVRVSTDEQTQSGAGLAAQRSAIEAECERRGLPVLAELADEGQSGSKVDRPALLAALDLLDRGEASVLMVAKLDRLTRSVAQAYEIMDRSRRAGWAVVALDLGVDTTTPAGEMMAGVASVFAQFERRLISQRTKDALAIKKSQGVQLGRPRTVHAATRARIIELREATGADGKRTPWRSIATTLTNEQHPTGQGGGWLPNTVRRICLAERPDLVG